MHADLVARLAEAKQAEAATRALSEKAHHDIHLQLRAARAEIKVTLPALTGIDTQA